MQISILFWLMSYFEPIYNGNSLPKFGAEFKIHEKVDHAATVILLQEAPMIVQIAKRTINILDVDLLLPMQRDFGLEAFGEDLEADNEVGEKQVAFPLSNPAGRAPGQKFRIAIDFGDQIEQLLLAVG